MENEKSTSIRYGDDGKPIKWPDTPPCATCGSDDDRCWWFDDHDDEEAPCGSLRLEEAEEAT